MWDDVTRFLLEPLSAPYVQRALLEIAILSVSVAIVGTYVVLRSLSFLTLALSHAIFPGVVLAALLGWNMLLTSMVVAVGISLLIGLSSRNSRVGHASAIGTIYTGAFAAGIMLISSAGLFRRLSEFLFGRLFAVGDDDIVIAAVVTLLALLAYGLARKEILLVSFDRAMAQAQGLPVAFLELGFLALLSLVVVAALPAVGNIQTVALLVTPPATARLLTDRLRVVMLLSGLISLLGGVMGVYLAWHLNLVSGAMVVLTLTIFFLLAYFFSPRYGLLTRRLRPARA
ncbi:metal ABC transporter permease [Candidatus Chlorohelix sp.]|uniref:metal ABC transporter permease n=1 Tax=Candidatus Chlorohelix sp. TaxID=3139201 RepID=UPI00302D548A